MTQIEPLRPCTDSARALHMLALANVAAQPEAAPCLGNDGQMMDPHVAMLLEWRATRARWVEMMRHQDDDTPESEKVYARRWALYDAATSQPPATLSGVLATLAMIHEDAHVNDNLQPVHDEAFRRLTLSLCAMVPRQVAAKVLAGL